jgi:hypothetical protein
MSDLINKTDNRINWNSLADFKKLLAEGGIKPYTPSAAEIKKIQDSGFKPAEDVVKAGSRIVANNSFYRATSAEKETLIRQLMMHRGNDSSSGFTLAKDELMQELGKTPMPKVLEALEDKTDGPNLTKQLVQNLLMAFGKEVVGEALDEDFNLNPLFLKTLNAGITELDLNKHEFMKHDAGSLVMSVGISPAAESRLITGTIEFVSPVGGGLGLGERILNSKKTMKELTAFVNAMKVSVPKVKNLAETANKAAGRETVLGVFAKGAENVFKQVEVLYEKAHQPGVEDITEIVNKMNRLTEAYNKMIGVLASRSHNTIREKQMVEALEELLKLLKTF